jgi:flagellar biosynthesis protein FlhA
MKNRLEVINNILSKGDILIAVGIIGVLAGMIIPLPPFLIDVLLAFNIGVGMVIIMVANFVEKPLDFSVFPSILLFTALLRIGMNVATTRKILLVGYAGEIIEAFGQFVVGGNYIVGVVIFLIIIVIQVMVITAGSTRISEVAARFTLDAMPGKQMSIDADLNSGLINEEEARERRMELSREADFYGAMDGAAKFVRGDVTAGLIITAVNIIGGLLIGVFMRGMQLEEALAKYTLLTVGDGLVAQVPSVVISVAAGIIVTRAGSSRDTLGREVIGQILIHPAATAVGGFTLLGAGLIPSMPLLPFLAIGSVLLGFSWYVHGKKIDAERREDQELSEERMKKPAGPMPVDELLHVDIMSLEIGYGLISLVDSSRGGDLLERINGIRRHFAMDLGLVVPPIRIRDNMQLGPNEYCLKIKMNEISRGELMPDFHLAMHASGKEGELVGVQTREPAFGLPAVWVNEAEKKRAESLGYTVVEATAVLATHLQEIIKKYGYELLVRQDVQNMVDNLKKRYPAVVDDIIPAKISVAQVHRVLQNLLKEQVSIRNLMTIFEVIGDYASRIKDMEIMTEYVRTALRMDISRRNASESGDLHVITLDPGLEQQLNDSLHKTEFGTSILLDPVLRNRIIGKLADAVRKAGESGISPVILTSPPVRPYLRRMIEKELFTIPVMSYSEIADTVKVRSLDMITLKSSEQAQASPR